MSTFTGSELEFLAGLDRRWWTLYWRELTRLLRGDTASGAGHAAGADRPKGQRGPTATILVLAPGLRACGNEACPLRRRRHAMDDGAAARVAAPR